ncbi:MAG: hypothetical protein EXS55_03355 [Candidatus Magasanikbacteria bacterium]|nr:hypothetical protein [Candidatus Magasanikbacteria bacterium]
MEHGDSNREKLAALEGIKLILKDQCEIVTSDKAVNQFFADAKDAVAAVADEVELVVALSEYGEEFTGFLEEEDCEKIVNYLKIIFPDRGARLDVKLSSSLNVFVGWLQGRIQLYGEIEGSISKDMEEKNKQTGKKGPKSSN